MSQDDFTSMLAGDMASSADTPQTGIPPTALEQSCEGGCLAWGYAGVFGACDGGERMVSLEKAIG
jgi:hypothetical protein